MHRRSLLWHIFPPFLVIIVLTLLLVTGYSSRALRHHQIAEAADDLDGRARLLAAQVDTLVLRERFADLQQVTRRLGQVTDTRFTVILSDGRVAADSHERPGTMDNHADRPEVQAALTWMAGRSERYSRTLQHSRLYVAVPGGLRGPDDEPLYVMRASLSLEEIDAALRRVYWQMAAGGAVLALLAAGVSFLVSRRLSIPLRRLQRGAERFAGGRLDVRLTAPDSEEIGALADAMNQMAAQLHDRIATIEKQRNELEAVLGSMVEGVLAVDTDETVIRLNRAGARLLGLAPERALGRSVQEVIRNPDLLGLAREALRGEGPVESDIIISREDETYLQVHATGLQSPDGGQLGALLVLNDVTRLRRLENMRRDFVANVSHELRTPITSIAGFVETLLENPPEDAEDAHRFLTIVHKQADRLNAIISDLLTLSRIEQEADQAAINFTEARVRDVLASAVAACTAETEGRPARVAVACPPELTALVNAPLLEQAIVNLVENALKFSEPDATVQVSAEQEDGEIRIGVADQGRGIEARHLPRLFERFYRVDKARSRKLGGTGLGLAIVKHIVQAHAGEVKVISEPGRGSTFTIVLPHSGLGGDRKPG
ncbi:MAG: ATP-binding protein [Candidatus Krumholzibacteriia bacterium]